MDSNEQSRLERAHEVALARLDVAEDFSWPLSFACGVIAYLMNWTAVGALAAFCCVFWIAPRAYRKAEAQAEDEWHRAAKLGRYVR